MNPEIPQVLIVGAGFAGFHCARELERLLRPGEARVNLASPNDYMLYSPLLPHVAAGTLNPADIATPVARRHRLVLLTATRDVPHSGAEVLRSVLEHRSR